MQKHINAGARNALFGDRAARGTLGAVGTPFESETKPQIVQDLENALAASEAEAAHADVDSSEEDADAEAGADAHKQPLADDSVSDGDSDEEDAALA